MSIARQYQLMDAKKKRPPPFHPARGADPLVEARQQVKALELKIAGKDHEIARLNRELARARIR